MFADASLAARIDRAEGRIPSGVVARTQARKPEMGAIALPVGGGMASFVSPRSPINKVVGLGFDGPLDAAGLEAVEEAFRTRGERPRARDRRRT